MLPDRDNPRHGLIDYSRGTYFVTVCCHARRHLFGEVLQGQMRNNSLGFLVQDEWHSIVNHYSNVSLDVFTTMPNHLHGVLALHDPNRDSARGEAKNLSAVVGSYKAGISRKSKQTGIFRGELIFQPRFYDHQIRHQRALERVREYVVNNPLRWSLDRENEGREGFDPFYEYIEAYARKIAPLRTG